MTTVYVLDTSALLSTWTQQQHEVVFLTTSHVLSELMNRPSKSRAESLISADLLQVREPDTKDISQVKKSTKESGDSVSLSITDVGIVALALAEFNLGVNPILVSSDFAVLNTALHLGISILDLSGKMREQRVWIYVCPACKHRENQPVLNMECPTCGTIMQRRATRRWNLSESK